MTTAVLGKLGSTVKNQGHFTDSQQKATDFAHVAAVWHAQTMSFSQGIDTMREQQKVIEDLNAPLSDFTAVVDSKDRFAIRHKPTGRDYVPTEKAVKDMAVIGLTSEWFISDMLSDKVKINAKGDEKVVFKRDRRDAEVLADVINLSLFTPGRIDQQKIRLFRTWNDGTLRAVLSEQYAIINNVWFLEVLEKLIPGGVLSHWRGDADTIFGNVLIPDSIRQESDSHYGGMLSVGNSEIGLRRILSMPSVFRAICMNGCIWEQEKGVAVNKVHRGEVDMGQLAAAIATNLQAQIPLLNKGIDALLGTRAFVMGDVPTVNVFAQFFSDYKIPKSLAPKFVAAYNTEVEIMGPEARSAFGLQAALTRVGQLLGNEEWVKYDQIAGQIAFMKRDRWDGVLARARTLQKEDNEKILGDISHLI